ncbi:PH domain-containing protein [Brachybacterium phenoliresistens]|uniref:YdbS-like PH domain-containing protein n=1 Tax=Brachybacterium phenoliresistens TaxID=396014 RepID=Z9JS73_9MICO|nr:PH domain-containing protein [Brachybacterium phenoliresistens]EWS80597.1 hypothetical protein BF93_03035 [Brachybacterium phenoliresistens]
MSGTPAPAPEQGTASAVPESAFRRTHPITPLVSGWKVIAAIVAAVSIQNIGSLVREFTLTRLLIGLGILAVVIVLSIVISALSWRFTAYAITEDGVALRSGVLTRSRRFAPRARIDSVSVERPLLARLLGLAKVRVEVAGGGESHLDIAYVRTADAERIRREILRAAASAQAGSAAVAPAGASAGPSDPGSVPPAGPPAGPAAVRGADGGPVPTEAALGAGPGDRSAAPGAASGEAGAEPWAQGAAPAAPAPGSLWDQVVLDGVSDGEQIARVPTARLVHSMVRDAEFLLGALALLLGLLVAGGLLLWDDGPGLGAAVALIPALVAVPRLVLGKIEAGWGFVARMTDRGLRMRRGLLNTRTDNVPPDRIQEITLSQPALWRSQRWTRVTATVAGIGDSESEGSLTVLPVGTPEELRRTVGHLLPPLGTEDDAAALEGLLGARARDIPGMRATRRWQWIARRTEVVVLMPGFLVRRSGILTRRLQMISRDRIQGVGISQGPIERRCGLLTLTVPVAGATLTAQGMEQPEVLAMRTVLEHDSAHLRRYRDRARWPRPALSPRQEHRPLPQGGPDGGREDAGQEQQR